jgi:Homeodomain-like domain-containing protein
MSRGRHTALHVTLTVEERQMLEWWARSTTRPYGEVQRARLVLLVAQGLPLTQVADQVHLTRRHVYKWLRRFLAAGVDGLAGPPTHPQAAP